MLRGAIIVFTALLSVAFLRRMISKKSWLGITMVIVGLVLVGVSDIVFSNPSDGYGINEIITGNVIFMFIKIVTNTRLCLCVNFFSYFLQIENPVYFLCIHIQLRQTETKYIILRDFHFLCTGDLIILVAQVISGIQMVIEEKFVNGKDIHPLQAVGWEGNLLVYQFS